MDLYFWGVGGRGKFSSKIIFFSWGWFFKVLWGQSFSFIFLFFFLFCGGSLLFFVQHSLIHSHIFWCFGGKCKCWTVCFFCFWT